MSLLSKLNLGHKKKKEIPASLNYLQKQEYIRSQKKKEKELAPPSKVAKPPVMRECPVCQNPMAVAVGQLMFCHKECKSRYKRALRHKR